MPLRGGGAAARPGDNLGWRRRRGRRRYRGGRLRPAKASGPRCRGAAGPRSAIRESAGDCLAWGGRRGRVWSRVADRLTAWRGSAVARQASRRGRPKAPRTPPVSGTAGAGNSAPLGRAASAAPGRAGRRRQRRRRSRGPPSARSFAAAPRERAPRTRPSATPHPQRPALRMPACPPVPMLPLPPPRLGGPRGTPHPERGRRLKRKCFGRLCRIALRTHLSPT